MSEGAGLDTDRCARSRSSTPRKSLVAELIVVYAARRVYTFLMGMYPVERVDVDGETGCS
jgi:hypothetical protein